ncbi:MAG: Cache 3/Cache 2 fusion domain-containing protein, partial [Fimbriimonadaceae bacterium]|nr:Cache 3/Cache 2 fusion domain-containing protein [Fimbriimonadaceae bacterium]
MKLRKRVLLMGGGMAAAVVVLMTGIGYWKMSGFAAQAEGAAGKLQDWSLDIATRKGQAAVDAMEGLLDKQVDGMLNEFEARIREGGGIHRSEQAQTWTAVNQYDKSEQTLVLPALKIGGKVMPKTASFSVPLPILDGLTKRQGGSFTVFQRMNEAGDMLRVATTVRTATGTRGVGTFIPAINPDGAPNKVIETILRKEPYQGAAFVVDSWVHAEYRPLLDPAGRVVGILYAGQKQQAVPAIRSYFEMPALGDQGRMFVLGAKGDAKGTFIIAPPGERDGDSILDATDTEGNAYVSQLIDMAVAAKDAEPVHLEATTDQKLHYRATYFPKWDWVIVTEVPDSAFADVHNALHSGRNSTILMMVGAGALILVAALALAHRFAGSLAGPIETLSGLGHRFSEGKDLQVPPNRT